mmetsp:Transcript_32832/g.29128  ORF Transcript_32832/g.29128 Transcript_32832/m.29128 type:complete len:302 (+) Transcript_32832:28-933(+)
MNGMSMSQASIHEFANNSKIPTSPIPNSLNAHNKFLNSSMRNNIKNMNNSQVNLNASGKKVNMAFNPTSPMSRGAISPSTRNRMNASTRIRSTVSMISSTSSKEFINIRARPILIDDGKPLLQLNDINYEIKPTFYKKQRTTTMKGKIKQSWLDIEAKNKSHIPDPGKYDIKEIKVNKMQFLKGKRVTEIQEYVKKNKWKLPPGIHYKNKPSTASSLRGNKGIMDSKGRRMGYIDDAVVKGQMSPSTNYKTDCQLTKKRLIYGNFSKDVGRKSSQKKKKRTGSTGYKHVESYYKTQVKNRV